MMSFFQAHEVVRIVDQSEAYTYIKLFLQT